MNPCDNDSIEDKVLISGKITKTFIYTTVMFPTPETPKGYFVIEISGIAVPNNGTFVGETLAVSVLDNTLINICGKVTPAKDLDLPKILAQYKDVNIELPELPKEIDTGCTWTAVAKYSGNARKIRIQ